MAFTVHEVSVYLVIVSPEAWSFAESFLMRASPDTRKSAVLSVLPSSDQVRKPNDLMRSLSRFSAIAEICAGPSARSASRVVIRTATFGSPLLRMKLMRSSRDISFSDFCTSRVFTTACVVTYASPSLPTFGSDSWTTVEM